MKTVFTVFTAMFFACVICFAGQEIPDFDVNIGQHIENLKTHGKTTVHNAEFSIETAAPSPETRKKLEGISKYMKENTDVAFDVVCYTGNEGGEAYCRRASAKRANWLHNYFTSQGISEERLNTAGEGIWKDETGVSKTGKVEIRVQNESD